MLRGIYRPASALLLLYFILLLLYYLVARISFIWLTSPSQSIPCTMHASSRLSPWADGHPRQCIPFTYLHSFFLLGIISRINRLFLCGYIYLFTSAPAIRCRNYYITVSRIKRNIFREKSGKNGRKIIFII